MKKPLILISNDDGVDAKGIRELINYLRPLGDLYVMAPDGARSGMSCAITTNKLVEYNEVYREEGLIINQCSGMPADCIKLATYLLGDRTPDLVVGGINHGDNSSINVHNSGTMGLVIEGCLKRIPSIGFSLCNHEKEADFTPLKPYILQITRQVLHKGLPHKMCLNVNFPDVAVFKGIKICRQTDGMWSGEWEIEKSQKKEDFFKLTGEFINFEPDDSGTDRWALAHSYVAVTPTTIDMTAYGFMKELEDWDFSVRE